LRIEGHFFIIQSVPLSDQDIIEKLGIKETDNEN